MSALVLTEEQLAFLDALIKEYPEKGEWDSDLVLWAYGKGFEAGLLHGRREKEER